MAIYPSILKSGVKLRTIRPKQNDWIILFLDVPGENLRPTHKTYNSKAASLRINYDTIIQNWLTFTSSLSLTVVRLTCWRSHPILMFMCTYIYNTFTLCCVPQNNLSNRNMTMSYRYSVDIDSNTADPTTTKRYRIDIESISTISTAIQLIRREHDAIVSISTAIQLIQQSRNDIVSYLNVNVYIYITHLLCVVCHKTNYPTGTWRYRIDIVSISTAIQLIRQPQNDIILISNRYRRYRQ